LDYLNKISSLSKGENQAIKLYEAELNDAKNKGALNNFNALISYLSSYYQEELLASDLDNTNGSRKRQPLKRDEI